jgi:hypothetical protein
MATTGTVKWFNAEKALVPLSSEPGRAAASMTRTVPAMTRLSPLLTGTPPLPAA